MMLTSAQLILFVLSGAGYVVFIANQLRITVYQALFVFPCSVALLLYPCALLGVLEIGFFSTFALGLGFIAHHLIINRLSFKVDRDCLWNLVILSPLFILYFSIPLDFNFLLWDEFSFWASSIKLIFTTDSLFNKDSPIFFKSYPPLQQLFQYFFLKSSFWSEKNVLYAQTFWVLSGVLCVQACFIKSKVNLAFAFLISSSFLYFFSYSYSTIYNDQLLGVCFAASVALACQQPKHWRSTIAWYISMGSLVLLKEIGLLLALISLGVFLINGFFNSEKATSVPLRLKATATRGFTGTLLIVILIGSWRLYASSLENARTFDLTSVSKLLSFDVSMRSAQTLSEFVRRIFKPSYLQVSESFAIWSPSLITFVVILLVCSIILTCSCSHRPERQRMGAVFAWIYLGLVGYIGALLMSYLIVFTEYEGVRLASFERYVSTYILALLLLTYALTVSTLEAKGPGRVKLLQSAFTVIVLMLSPSSFFQDLRQIQTTRPEKELRVRLEAFANRIKPLMQMNEKVYFIAQNTNGLERTMFYYGMLPYTSSMSWCWSIGAKYFDGDVWTCNTNLQDIVQGYDYLALYKVDQQFWDRAGTLFTPSSRGGDSGIYKINRDIKHNISIERVD
jgi:hypothetical protein